ncbi:response regulator [Alteromonas sp. a30]|uniref:response regulator n=1 Tax=Alteromonas sp. a30 TaxID=2730917 RepID=UPI002282EE57|nr:response regulator [Alteromonas sp. a30]MCY7295710.1 response regulator [Alteromonas sp. a30]
MQDEVPKVLVIEDSVTSMKVIKHLIMNVGLEPVGVNCLADAEMALARTNADEFLCAVVDYCLPDALDGEAIDFTISAAIPTVVITGRLDEATRTSVLNRDVVDYIPKENAQVYEYLGRLIKRLEKNREIGVLVVDDSRLSRTMITSLLDRHNFITYEASDGEEGLAALRQYKNIQLVITDENMPNMTGLDMVAEIRRTISKDDLAIIGLSGEGSSALSARFIKSGANDYLNKPYCHEEFFCRVIQNVEYIENIEAIRRASNTDYLTGLPNRRHFFTRISANLKIAPVNVVIGMVDVDMVHWINESYGYEAGDKVLKEIAALLEKHFPNSHVSRFGGEEFCIYSSGLPIASIAGAFEAFQEEVSHHRVYFEGNEIQSKVSIGVTSQFNGDIHESLKVAGANLHKAREQGDNQVVFS